MTATERIEEQQKGKETTAVWMVGEQLKDIIRGDEHSAGLVETDLQNEEKSLKSCEEQISAYAYKNKSGSVGCVPPQVAEDIIRKFYGLPERVCKKEQEKSNVIDLFDML